MATYTLANLQTDIRNYTEVSDTVLTDDVLERIIKNAEHTICLYKRKAQGNGRSNGSKGSVIYA